MSASKWKPYPEYKNSERGFGDRIPKNWEETPLKFSLERNDGGVWGEDPDGIADTIVLRSTEQTYDGKWKIEKPAMRKLTREDITSALLQEGDLLITKSSGSSLHIGKTTIVDSRIAELNCCYSNFMQRLRPSASLYSQYAWYLLNNDTTRMQLDFLSKSTTGLANLNATIIGQVIVTLPPISEQILIAKFLNHRTEVINTAIAVLRKKLFILKEKRSALITQAVTKGLDHSVPMKDSGIESLGRIPEHWYVTSLKRNWDVIDCKHVTPIYTDDGIPYVYIPEVKPVRLDPKNATRFVSYEDYLFLNDGRMPSKGDVIYCRNASLGVASYVDTDDSFVLGQDLVLITSKQNNGLFLTYLLNSSAVTSQIESEGVGSTFKRINVGQIKELLLSIPPSDEQEKIAIFCDKVHTQISSLIVKTESKIKELNEYRTALISAALTGKIDVRLV